MCDVVVDAVGFAVGSGGPEIITCIGGGGGGSRPFGKVVEVMEVVIVVVTTKCVSASEGKIRI